jgi:hypothetical protein
MKDWAYVFNWQQIDGLTLKISVGTDEQEGVKTSTVVGLDESSGKVYVIHVDQVDLNATPKRSGGRPKGSTNKKSDASDTTE